MSIEAVGSPSLDQVLPQEGGLPSPKMHLRPHHIFMEEVRDALLHKKTPESIASDYSRKVPDNTHIGYADDVLGRSRDVEGYETRVRPFFAALAELSDDDTVQLDLEKDGLCQANCVGAHCTATNLAYEKGPRAGRPEEIEIAEMIRILYLDLLMYNGRFHSGRDYETRRTQHQFQDYHGRSLNTPVPTDPIDLQFDGVVVKVGVLRKALESHEAKFRNDSVPSSMTVEY